MARASGCETRLSNFCPTAAKLACLVILLADCDAALPLVPAIS